MRHDLNPTLADQPFFFSTSTMTAGDPARRPIEPVRPQSGTVSAAEDLVQRAKREVSAIVREVSEMTRQPIEPAAFFIALAERIQIAIAAQGVVVWQRTADQFRAITRCGQYTDHQIPAESIATHHRMLREVDAAQAPVVVPSTPGATDPDVPYNPAPYPTALVPLIDVSSHGTSAHPPFPATEQDLCSDRSRYLSQVFLESDAGVATQRGYLRFITQLGDLASDYLRNEEIRVSRERERWLQLTGQAFDELTLRESAEAIATHIVDSIADLFAASRVSLARIHNGTATLLAVSHVDSIDHRSPAARRLCKTISQIRFGGSNDRTLLSDSDASFRRPAEADDKGEAPWVDATPGQRDVLGLRNQEDSLRILLQDDAPKFRSEVCLDALSLWAQPSLSLLAARLRLESIPLAGMYLALTPQFVSLSPTRLRRALTVAGAILTMSLVAMIPTPMLVTVPATLRPEGAQTIFAPSDAVIETMTVKHGQVVAAGDVLLRLRDWTLEEQIATLLARHAIVSQRLQRTVSSLLATPATNASPPRNASVAAQDDQLVQEQRVLEEEMKGIDHQLQLLRDAQQRLEIRATAPGVVDAWQTEKLASDRPVTRGELLVRVLPVASRWKAHADVPQSRLTLVMNSVAEKRLSGSDENLIHVATLADPEQRFVAKYSGRKTILNAPMTDHPSGQAGEGYLTLELKVERPVEAMGNQVSPSSWTYGSPAIATIDCGKRPLYQVVFYDFIRSVKRAVMRWT